MPEVSKDAAILIATSWQALNRTIVRTDEARLCDCTVVILFAGFYIEANLNYIITFIGQKKQMTMFLNNSYPGLQDKLAWFYNQYVARQKDMNKKQLFRHGIKRKLRRKYSGFADLYRFRNDISHGVINQTANSTDKTHKLRQQAKDIVESLFDTIENAGHDIPRETTYWEAIVS